MPIVNVPRYREFVSLLRKRLPGKRASHCIFVAEYLGSFAAKADVDQPDDRGRTPVCVAAQLNQHEALEYLCVAGPH